MGIFDLYSKRRRRERGEIPDVYSYDEIPVEFRIQVVHILNDALGLEQYQPKGLEIVQTINKVLRREYGVFRLAGEYDRDFEELVKFFLGSGDVEIAIDVIELNFRCIDRIVRNAMYEYQPKLRPDDAISELNGRFQEAAIGYQYDSGEIVRVDSQFVHSQAVKPALTVLADPAYEGANEEFRKAHEHYRSGRPKEAINECLKSLESVLKSICISKNWTFRETDTARVLIGIVLDNGILPKFMESQLGTFRSLLESGIPAVRNKTAGHGQGEESVHVPNYLASYALHLTATTILLLADAAKDA
ncbi:MAG: hypothetical protein RL885_26730 [Planctomycetota bacterium]